MFSYNLYGRTTTGLLRSDVIPFKAPLFYGIHQFEQDFGLTAKYKQEFFPSGKFSRNLAGNSQNVEYGKFCIILGEMVENDVLMKFWQIMWTIEINSKKFEWT